MDAPHRDRNWAALLGRAVALVLGAACIAYATVLAGDPRSALLFAGAASVALVAAVVTLHGWAVGAAMASIALTYCYGVVRADEGVDAGAPLVGVGLLLVGELLDLARASGEGRLTEGEVWRRRLTFLLGVAAVGGATGLLALLAGGTVRGTGPALLFFAAAAALAGLVAVYRMVRSLMRDGAPGDRGR